MILKNTLKLTIVIIFFTACSDHEPEDIKHTEDSGVIFSDDFEGTLKLNPSNLVYDQWYSSLLGEGQVKISSGIQPREGSQCIEANLKTNADGKSRAEIGINLKNSLGDYWCGFSTYIPSEYDISRMVLDSDKFACVMAQWGVWLDNPGLPDFALRFGNEEGIDKFFLTYEPALELVYLWDAPLIQGEWVDWVFHINWQKDNSGAIEIWQNSYLVFSKYNFRSTDGAGSDVKSKIGLYFAAWDDYDRGYDEIKVHYDDYSIAKGIDMYEVVAPGESFP
ncbi:MAG: heparin lyase I family protein [Marinifilaceae bacterium]|nr:heparin lyase I family protein [Marinifilaceae bacterium]